MLNLARRVKKLESARTDVTGLAPHSDAWFAFWEEKANRLIDGEDIGNVRIPLEVIDRIVERADRVEVAASPISVQAATI
jgi:hypothetical protein